MPLLDSIILLPTDLANILDRLRQLKHNGPVKIIDTHGSLTIRDENESFLTDVKRGEMPEYQDTGGFNRSAEQ